MRAIQLHGPTYNKIVSECDAAFPGVLALPNAHLARGGVPALPNAHLAREAALVRDRLAREAALARARLAREAMLAHVQRECRNPEDINMDEWSTYTLTELENVSVLSSGHCLGKEIPDLLDASFDNDRPLFNPFTNSMLNRADTYRVLGVHNAHNIHNRPARLWIDEYVTRFGHLH